MDEYLQVQEDLSQLIDRLKPVQNFLAQNTYVRDTTKKLNRIIDDASKTTTVLLLGKERVGKTSIINSILGRELLSSSTMNPTSVNTYIKYGESEYVKAVFLDQVEVIFDIHKLPLLTTSVTESAKIIREHIDYIEIYVPHDLLKNIILVDTVALESNQGGAAYFSQHLIERVDEVYWVIRAGSPLTDAEQSLLDKYYHKGIRPHIIVNAKDVFSGNLQQFIEQEKQRYGDKVQSFIEISSKQAMSAVNTNDKQLLIDSNIVQLQQKLENFGIDGNHKLEKIVARFADWLVTFKLELEFIPTREPYLSALQSVEQYAREQHLGSTRDERDHEIVNAYREEYKEISSVFKPVQTLYQLLQLLTITFYLRDDEVEKFEELAFAYQQNVRDYRKLYSEYSHSYSRNEAQYKKMFGKYLQQWSINDTNELMTSQVEQLQTSYSELKDLRQLIKVQEKLLLQNFYKTQNHLTDLANRRLSYILQQVSELNHQRKMQMVHLQSYHDKLQEFKCLEEAQRFLLDAVQPYLLEESLEISAPLKLHITTLFTKIKALSLPISQQQQDSELQRFDIDFEQDYPLTPLSLTEADIVSDIPELPASM